MISIAELFKNEKNILLSNYYKRYKLCYKLKNEILYN